MDAGAIFIASVAAGNSPGQIRASRSFARFAERVMHRRKRNRLAPDAGLLVIEDLAGQRRMQFVQFDGERILASECKCRTLPTIDCPVDIHKLRAFQILSDFDQVTP